MQRNLIILVLLSLVLMLGGCPEDTDDSEVETGDYDAPQTLRLFSAEASTLRVKLTWETPDEDDSAYNEDMEGILIIRAAEQYPQAYPLRGDDYQVGDALGAGIVIANLDPEVEEFNDETIQAGVTYFYEAMTYDELPNYSETTRLNSTPGSLVQARLSHTQTNLSNGKVLLCGGVGHSGPLDTAEMYDPESNAFRPLLTTMTVERFGHTATLLNDGRVLLVGGYQEGFLGTLRTAEIFDPTSESFGEVADEMDFGRALHTATRLNDGRVLIIGGTDGVNALASMVVFDPTTLKFSPLENELLRARFGHGVVLVEDFVFVLGGFGDLQSLPFAAMIDTEDFRVTDFNGNPQQETDMLVGSLNATVNAVDDDLWLLAGGYVGSWSADDPTADCELFDPAGEDYFIDAGSLDQARSGHAATTLLDGRVLIAGGVGVDLNILDSAEIYDPVEGAFSSTGNMRLSRTVHGQSLLSDGRVLVTGGNRSIDVFEPEPASTAETYDPDSGSFTVVGAK